MPVYYTIFTKNARSLENIKDSNNKGRWYYRGQMLLEELDDIWKLLNTQHINKYGYSGSLIRALRIKNNLTREHFAQQLHKKRSTVEKWENSDKIGIKLAKDLAYFFKLKDWRILRNREMYIENIKDKPVEVVSNP
jgi:DNA-binding XRE family transcriptional regulator